MLFKRHTRSGKFRRRTKTHTIEPTNFVQKNIHYVDIIVIIKLFEVLSNLTYLLYYYDLSIAIYTSLLLKEILLGFLRVIDIRRRFT